TKKYINDFEKQQIEVKQLFNIFKLRLAHDTDLKKVIAELKEDPSIEYAELNYYFYTMDVQTNDPLTNTQWYLNAVNAPQAWEITTGYNTQKIAIIDTGVDWTHPDLMNKIWLNTQEIPDNGIDDDNNGFVDDIRGWDFINNDNNPMDDNSHGTHVAGIAGASANNETGIAGIDWNAHILPLKVLQSSGYGSSDVIALAVDYARNNGATVINMSLGSYGESLTLKYALENAYNYTIIVAAAGNDASSVDLRPMYPACYSFVIGVQASKQSSELASFSNRDLSGPVITGNAWGHNYEITAPGVDILSTFPNGGYRSLSGTSMASPIVAGAVSLMRSHLPNQSNEEIFAKLIQSANNGILDISGFLNHQLTPQLSFVAYTLTDDSPACDNDGIADAGETIQIYFKVKNTGALAQNVTSTLSLGEFEDPSIATILNNTSNIGDISTYATLTGVQNPFLISINSNVANNRDIMLNYTISGSNCSTISGNISIKVQRGAEYSGYISGITRLSPDKVHIITGNVVFDSLEIDPGSTVRLNDGASILVANHFVCNGTKDSLITFTHNQNGYWKNIESRSPNSSLSYCIFEYSSPSNELLKG
ncbi:MAG TPA: S8 family serine peptidase, partial [Candidatus Cloacimonadota bacterium]|nr:S8 family serine peptidase [Candidatus Cloacimonadota bacterium]